jgi:hypothetical protein
MSASRSFALRKFTVSRIGINFGKCLLGRQLGPPLAQLGGQVLERAASVGTALATPLRLANCLSRVRLRLDLIAGDRRHDIQSQEGGCALVTIHPKADLFCS